MRKFYLICLIFICSILSMDGQEISYVNKSGGYYNIYESSGSKLSSVTISAGELVGYSASVMILKHNGWYNIYNSKGQKIKSLSISYVGDIINVNNDTFTSRNGSWIYVWNLKGEKISTKTI